MNQDVIEWLKEKYSIFCDVIEIDNNYYYKLYDIETNNCIYANYFKFMQRDTAEKEAIKRAFEFILRGY